MRVNEIFTSLQGEGIYQGVPTAFLRLQGCNLRCSWCDTAYAQDEQAGTEMSTAEVVREIQRSFPLSKVKRVCITGGEPLLQEDKLYGLVGVLRKNDFEVDIETNGSFPPPIWYALASSWSADIKCPSSGIQNALKRQWFSTRRLDQLKFVVADEEDLRFTEDLIRQFAPFKPTVLVSPLASVEASWDGPWLQRVADFCVSHDVRFSLQLHKILWGDKRGV